MVTRLAFTSCSDPMDDPVQPVWDAIADFAPHHLVLLGDQVYMDYGMLIFHSNNPPLGRPAKMTNVQFAQAMHERYARQWGIFRNSKLAKVPELRIHGIWDDHDFAWNNSYGNSGSNAASGPCDKNDPVPRDKQAISRRLMGDFFGALRSSGASYPENPFTAEAVDETDLRAPMVCAHPPDAGGSVVLAPGVKLLLTDGRSFRTRTNRDDATVFGEAQWDWLHKEMRSADICVLASGTTLDNLNLYGELDRLLGAADEESAQLLCLTGDVHKVDWRHHGPRVYEAVASGAARTMFGRSGAFGLLQIDSQTITVTLHDAGRTFSRVIERSTWKEKPASTHA